MKKQKLMTTGFLAAALALSFTGVCYADTAPAADTQTAGQEQPGALATDGREILPANFGMPYSFPTKGQHPRLMFTEKDLPDIRANMSNQEGAYAMKELQKLLAQDVDGMLPDEYVYDKKSNLDYNTFAVIEAYAFDYAVNGNVENGKRAVEAARNVVNTFKYREGAADVVREKGVCIFLSSIVYDWCYPLMSAEDKALFVAKAEELADTISGMQGWPMSRVYSVNGHNEETHIKRDLLSLSIACYDEYPDIYNHVAGYIMNGLVPTKNWWFRSGTFHQGLGYNPLRFGCDMFCYFLFYRMNGTKIYSDDIAMVPYMEVYNQRPDGRSFPEGDTNGDSLFKKIPTWVREDMPHLLYASSIWDDGVLKGEFQRCSKNFNWLYYKNFHPLLTPVRFLIVNDPNVKPETRENIPLTRLYDSPVGMMLARTGFSEGVEAPDMLVWAKIGETYAGNHAHLDSGSFQIYYKGQLAWDNGRYDSFGSDHDANYAKETIAHNSLLIYDPEEEMIGYKVIPEPQNSGGQQRIGRPLETFEDLTSEEAHQADLLAMEYGEDPLKPEYSYISGDLAPGYADYKVSEVRRSMLFMPTGIENKPGIFVVMDKVTAKNPSYKKSFLLHSLQAPEVDGNVTVIKRDQIGYNGKLINQTLYPLNPEITMIGGPERQNWVVDRNYAPKGGKYYSNYDPAQSSEHGWGRVEISPSTPANTDYFLNVMYATDADNLEPVDEAELIETDVLLGARILDKVTLFVKDKERYSGEMTVTIPGEGQIAAALAGITAGEWTITDENGNVQTKTAKEEGGIIYFTGEAGTYHIQKK